MYSIESPLDHSAAQTFRIAIKHNGLTRRDGALGTVELDLAAVFMQCQDAAVLQGMAVPDTRLAGAGRLVRWCAGDPTKLARLQPSVQQQRVIMTLDRE